MNQYYVLIGLQIFAMAVGFGLGFVRSQQLRNSWQAAAFQIPFQNPICKRCGIRLKVNGVMFVDHYPGPGQLYCRTCFQQLTPGSINQVKP